MPFQSISPVEWTKIVADLAAGLNDRAIANALMGYQLLPGGPYADTVGATVHRGSLTIDGDFIPPSQVVVIDGDLIVSGTVFTNEHGGDGGVTLVVFGDLRCSRVDHEWNSILFVTDDMSAEEWVLASREDSSLTIGGNFRTPIFVGADLWVSVGGTVEMTYGYGYAVELAWDRDARGAPQIEPEHGWRELAIKLGMDRESARDEEAFLMQIEARLTGSGVPDV